MLDILYLAVDPYKQKSNDKDQLCKQMLSNAIMLRLKERNTINQMQIKNHIKKTSKRRVKTKFTLAVCEGIFLNTKQISISQCQRSEQIRRCPSLNDKKLQPSPNHYCISQQMVKVNELKNTNNTANDILSQSSQNPIPNVTLNLIKQTQETKKSGRQMGGVHSQVINNNSFTKYLRNFFINRLNQRDKEREKQSPEKLDPKKKYQGRTHTEISIDERYKVKVKSLVFGQSEAAYAKDAQNSIPFSRKARIHTETCDANNPPRYINKLEQESNKLKNGVLPMIHNSLATRNKRCLQNYIRFHHDKLRKSKPEDFRTVKLPTQADLIYHCEPAPRNKLTALHVCKV